MTNDQMKLEAIAHVDGRFWLRKNGRIIYEDLQRPTPEELAKVTYRKIGGTIAKAVELLAIPMAVTRVVTHPQFVRPYSLGVVSGYALPSSPMGNHRQYTQPSEYPFGSVEGTGGTLDKMLAEIRRARTGETHIYLRCSECGDVASRSMLGRHPIVTDCRS